MEFNKMHDDDDGDDDNNNDNDDEEEAEEEEEPQNHHHHNNNNSSSNKNNNNKPYSPPPLDLSPFSKPLLSPSASLLRPHGGGGGGGGAAVGGGGGGGGGGRYRECLRNHAACLGGHVVDGCGEFAPGERFPMKCAACGCHRSFHRQLEAGAGAEARNGRICVPGDVPRSSSSLPLPDPAALPCFPPPPLHRLPSTVPDNLPRLVLPTPPPPPPPPPPLPTTDPPPPRPRPRPRPRRRSPKKPPQIAPAADRAPAPAPATATAPAAGAGKKRYRTRFTAEQKEKMVGFAERVGWRLQKADEEAADAFCAAVGIRRQVLKVWMNNNKLTKRPQKSPNTASAAEEQELEEDEDEDEEENEED